MNLRSTLIALPLVALFALPACEEKKPPAPPPPPPPPPKVEAPPPPKPVDIATVLQQARADARVQFPKDHAPVDRTLAEAVIQLASALAKGDDKALAPLLAPGAKSVLESLTKSGDWARGTKGIEAVRVVSLSAKSEDKPTTSNLGLAIQMPGEAFLLGWTATKAGNTWTFKNAWAEGETKTRASEFDGAGVSSAPAGGGATLAMDSAAQDLIDINMLIVHETVTTIMKDLGRPVPEEQMTAMMKQFAGARLGAGFDPKESMDRGRRIVDSGKATEIFNAQQLRVFVDSFLASVSRSPMAETLTKDKLLASIAKTLKLTKERVAEMYEQGAGAKAPGQRPAPAPAPSRTGGD